MNEVNSPQRPATEAPQQALPDELVTRVRSWIAEKPDPACRQELRGCSTRPSPSWRSASPRSQRRGRVPRDAPGFKWIMRATEDTDPQRRIWCGYEEALGCALNDVVREKDGISASRLLCRAAAEAARSGTTLLDRLDHPARRRGP